jgi:hypothetical protein
LPVIALRIVVGSIMNSRRHQNCWQQSPAEFRRNMTIIYKAGSLDESFKITV